MDKKIYADLLKERFKHFEYYFDKLLETTTDFEFFGIVARFIVPLIRESKSFEHLYFQCVREKDIYLKLRAELEKKAPLEFEQSFILLKLDLKIADKLEDSEIKERIDVIQKVFEQKQEYAIPSYLNVVYQQMGFLLEQFLEIGLMDVVKKYAAITDRKVKRHNKITGEIEEVTKFYLNGLIFAPSYSKLLNLDDIWNPEFVQKLWVVWEYMVLVEWCWNTPLSFFADKTENYGNFQLRNTSIHLLTLYDYWCQIDAIKKHNGGASTSPFCRKLFTKYLVLIRDEIVLEQETDLLVQKNLVFYAVELRFDNLKQILLLDVQWSEDGGSKTFVVKRFNSNFGHCSFVHKLFDVPCGHKVSVVDCNSSGGSVAKYFKRSNVDNILGELFFEKSKHNKTRQAVMKTRKISCSEISEIQRQELARHIKGLKVHEPLK